MGDYRTRVIDAELDELLTELPAIAIEGPKGVGKTATAQRRAAEMVALDDAVQREMIRADPGAVGRSTGTLLIDEWQRHPVVWDEARRSVDQDPRAGRFILTGSAVPTSAPMHSGAGRIVSLRMRPMALAERGLGEPTVSLRDLLAGRARTIKGESTMELPGYIEEIVRSGFPGIRPLSARGRRIQLDGYIDRIIQRDFAELDHQVRRPATLRAWLKAYAAATSTTAAYNAILDTVTAGDGEKPAKSTTITYRDVLSQLWLLDPVPGWLPIDNSFARLAQAPKHHLADPALAARLLDLDVDTLRTARPPGLLATHCGVSMVGRLFESLVALSLQVYAQYAEARVHHMRTKQGIHEIDFIVSGLGGRIVALEVKLSATVDDRDVAHLNWLRGKVGDQLADAVVVTTGRYAYRRPDGIAVVPAQLLGP